MPCFQEVPSERGIVKKGQALLEGLLESQDLVNRPVWVEKIFSGDRGQREEEGLLCAWCCAHVTFSVYSNPKVV